MDLKLATQSLPDRFANVRDVTPVLAGAWSTPYFCTADIGGVATGLVARFGPQVDDDFVKDVLASAWSASELPTPRAHALFTVDDGYGVVTERHSGTFLEELDPAGWWSRALPRVFTAIDHLRQVPLQTELPAHVAVDDDIDTGLDAAQVGLGLSWHGWLTDRSDDPAERGGGWSGPLAASPTGDRSFHEGMELLATLKRRTGAATQLRAQRLAQPQRHRSRTTAVACARSSTGAACSPATICMTSRGWSSWAPRHAGMAGLDIRAAARAHFGSTDPAIDAFDERMRVFAIHIGLCHPAYNAFVGKPDEIAACDRRMAQYDGRRDPAALDRDPPPL